MPVKEVQHESASLDTVKNRLQKKPNQNGRQKSFIQKCCPYHH